MKLVWSKAGEISENGCWCLWCDGYLYTHDTWYQCVWLAIREWKHDRHMIG